MTAVLIASLIIATVVGVIVAVLGGPLWAAFGFGAVLYFEAKSA